MFGRQPVRTGPLGRRLRQITDGQRREEAVAFLKSFYQEADLPSSSLTARLGEVKKSLRQTGTYTHTPEELAFGARLAWRNHAKCIGRLFWKSLEVVDRRHVRHPDEIAAEIFRHLGEVCSAGKIRSRITIFAPETADLQNSYSLSPQALQYAGYQAPGRRIVGDGKNVEITRTARALGWKPPVEPGSFDLLPLILSDNSGSKRFYPLPPEAVHEVAITHPACPAFSELGLKWYAVPLVTNMVLSIGGVEYPCAPFNGFYMGTEIASRNFTDERRYDLLRAVAVKWFGTADYAAIPLWQDEVALELNRAVLHSFRAANVTMLDHHQASEQYVEFEKRELSAGRTPSSKWSWIVPPQAPSLCPVYHRPMRDMKRVPNFYFSRVTDGQSLQVDRSDELRSRAANFVERATRRMRRWRYEHERWFQ